MKSSALLILASASSSSAQLNRVAGRQLLRRQRRNTSSKASKEPTTISKPPHSHIMKTVRPTYMPSAGPSKASKVEFTPDEIDSITSLSMKTTDSLSFSIEIVDPEFGEWNAINEIELKSLSMSASMSIIDVDPDFGEWQGTEFEWSGESLSMSV